MPKIRFDLFSQRNRPIDDLVDVYLLNGKRVGPVRDERDIKPTNKKFTVDVPPDKYELQLEIDGFKLFRGVLDIKATTPTIQRVELTHRCSDLPEFKELSAGQKALLATFRPDTSPSQIWQELSDNQAATFFQLSHTLVETKLTNGRKLSSYIETVRRIGGVEIEDTIPDGKTRTATGWRLHVVIRAEDREPIVSDLMAGGTFGPQDDFTHSTHARFGLKKSHRETGPRPKLQIVLSENNDHEDEDNVHADVDLDVEFDLSAPHDVFKHFIKRFPGVAGIYGF
jgi:hypothetical protein